MCASKRHKETRKALLLGFDKPGCSRRWTQRQAWVFLVALGVGCQSGVSLMEGGVRAVCGASTEISRSRQKQDLACLVALLHFALRSDQKRRAKEYASWSI